MLTRWAWARKRSRSYGYQCCRGADGQCEKDSKVLPWYDSEGNPQVDKHRFPDLRGMTEKMHGMGLRAGWYMGNYQCGMGSGNVPPGGWDLPKLAAGSVKAIQQLGFDSVKVSGPTQSR